MPYTYNTPEDVAEMLAAIGVQSIDELYDMVPDELQLDRPLDLPPAMGEMELDAHMRQLSGRNRHPGDTVSFLGGGRYDHFVPAVVDAIASRGEFYTSYTPYQAEVSQGNLQAMFEYQTMIARLTGLDVSNNSLYDGATATTEAVLMAIAAMRGAERVVVPETLHPEYRQTIETYLDCLDVELVTVPMSSAGRGAGVVDVDELRAEVTDKTACVVVQHPNFFGTLEDVDALTQVAHDAGALLVAVFDPISLGLIKRPGDWNGGDGADIACAEGQCLGSPMQYGGPYLGIMACRENLVRRMPGRIVGQTTDRRGKDCYTLTLQTREQHIRREKATSNVCSNQGLFALRATIYLSLLGPQGLKETAELCLQKSRYLFETLSDTDRFEAAFDGATFKEFVIRDREGKVDQLIEQSLAAGYFAGVPLGQWYAELDDCLLVAVTEKRTKAEMDAFCDAIANDRITGSAGSTGSQSGVVAAR